MQTNVVAVALKNWFAIFRIRHQYLGVLSLCDLAHDGCGQADPLQLCLERSRVLRRDRQQQAARGLRVEKDLLHGEGHPLEPDEGACVVAVSLTGGGKKTVVRCLPRTGQDGHGTGVDPAGQPPAHHLLEVACPLPVVKAKKAIAELNGAGEVEVLVDNEIAVQNLTKMAQQKGYRSAAEKLAEREYRVLFLSLIHI